VTFTKGQEGKKNVIPILTIWEKREKLVPLLASPILFITSQLRKTQIVTLQENLHGLHKNKKTKKKRKKAAKKILICKSLIAE